MKSRNSLARLFALSFVIAATLSFTSLAQGQVPNPSRAAHVLDSMPHAKTIDQVALSPDGTEVAYMVEGELTVLALGGGAPHSISVEGNLPLRELAWSADSKQLAFLADLPGDIPAAQLWTAEVDGGAPVKRAELKGYAQTPRFSPDGSKLGLLFIEGMPRVAGPLQPMTPLAGVVDEKIYEQRLATVDLSKNDLRKNDPGSNQLTQVTPADIYVYEYDWAPDGQSWAAIAAHGNGDANWWVARLYRIGAQTGEMHEIYKPKLELADPHVSPDGKNVAFIEGLMSDAGLTGGEIQVIPLAGGAARNLTPGIKASPSALTWSASDRIVFAQNLDGNSSFATVGINGGALQTLWTGEELTGAGSDGWEPSGSFSRDASSPDKLRIAVVRESGSTPPEIWAGAIGRWNQVTHLNADVKPAWGETRNVHWMNGSTRVQGWLTLPKDFIPGKTYPLVVNVHGGPAHACTSHWDAGLTGAEAALGYFALCPNPRGSYGQGEAFTQGNVKDFGGGDYRDIMAGVEALAQQYPIDPKRIGIRGHSYGGYMAMWAETQTTRFAAAVAGAGLSDWLSYYGLNDIDEWMIPFFGASVYDDPAVYAKSDPMHFVKAVKTPTLILVGDRDGEVPMEQSVEWWHALKAMNVPTTLVVYPNEGHMFVKPADARDYNLRALEWFDGWFAKAAGH
ncbi:MAG TPA: prolyl oligopeptidase family serine peptidase [Candidatus Sulfotelmatobacter sp.]|nr:prolyl oligopeptidase family serine peptidase [Candidatus Sulfotelmatobacter sp.]